MRRMMLVLIFLLCSALPVHSQSFRVLQVDIDGSISPAQEGLLADSLTYANDNGYQMLLVRLDTPGGLGSSMRSMVKTLLNAPVPVGVWVGPSGAHAASAGVFLVAASDVAGMAPQTTIGAASPVGLSGGDIDETMRKKIHNDFISLLKSVAGRKNRNIGWYAASVEHADSISADEALRLHVVENVSLSPREFLADIAKQGFSFRGKSVSFNASDAIIERFDPGMRYMMLSWLLHPQVAFILLLGGIIGLFIEFTHPGAIFPGVMGGLCLLVALYALSILPTSATGVLLILFALILLGLEVTVTSYGLLSVAGAVSIFLGGMLLFRDPYGYFHLPMEYVLVPSLVFSIVAFTLLWLVLRSRKTQYIATGDTLVGESGVVVSWKDNRGQIRVRGEIWAAKASLSDFEPSVGQHVKIISRNGLTLDIELVGSQPSHSKA